MKRFDMSALLFALALVILIVEGCAKVQRPSLDTGSYLNRGVAYGKKGQYDQAIVDFNKAIELNPRDAAAYYNRGISYEKRGQHDRAILDFTKAIEINPRYAKAYINRGLPIFSKKNTRKHGMMCLKYKI